MQDPTKYVKRGLIILAVVLGLFMAHRMVSVEIPSLKNFYTAAGSYGPVLANQEIAISSFLWGKALPLLALTWIVLAAVCIKRPTLRIARDVSCYLLLIACVGVICLTSFATITLASGVHEELTPWIMDIQDDVRTLKAKSPQTRPTQE